MRRSHLRWMIPTFLALQLGLLWIQGAQIHRQNLLLQGLREDFQALADTLESSQFQDGQDDTQAVPALQRQTAVPLRIAARGAGEEPDAAAKELKASQDSAQKAVKDAREVQSKLSLEENSRKADEQRKANATTSSWRTWAIALSGAALLLLARLALRRRG